ncbi:MAG: single-stranded-DNA-specific exonuclease RecJ [Candidatus Omnitrophota bacterium]
MNWMIQESDREVIAKLEKELGLGPLIALLLSNRKIQDIKEAEIFLKAQMCHLRTADSLKGVKEAVKRIKKAKDKKEKVFIFGDYDVDGICACALLSSTLGKLGLKTISYLPHRVEEGYGINMKALEAVRKAKAKLFISVDCGITSFKEIDKLRKFKIDSIIIDHHEPKTTGLPKANVIINPKSQGEDFFYDLTAVGLVFKLCQALLGAAADEDLDLVALGTICDVASLLGENRILVKEGLKKLDESKRAGILALKEVAGIKDKPVSVGLVGFVLGPRLNAMGRIDSALSSLRLLTTDDLDEAKLLAKSLDETNRRRQKIEEKILQEALIKIEREVNFKEHSIIVVGGIDWHPGVVGIVAAKLADKYWRPTFVLGLEKDVYRGSGRSVNNFHLFEALSECDSLLETYGGHRAAAGLTVQKDNLEKFKTHINAVAKKRVDLKDLVPILKIDAQVPLSTWQDLTVLEEVENLAPFGVGNQRPVFCSRNLFLKSTPSCVGRNTLRLWVSDGTLTVKAIGFGMADYAALLKEGSKVDLAYCVSLDTWQEPTVQLEIKDLKLQN